MRVDDGTVAAASLSAALPPALLADLRVAFGREVDARLPHLRAVTDLETAQRDAHTIASAAWVIGEPVIAKLAREVESGLPGGPVAELVAALERYLA
ncbi:MAG: hypothetical protein JWO22_1868 [Frankiales bacterium]|nr:hypothetical protein [Frankiales bacterium]